MKYNFNTLKAELIEKGIEQYILECWAFGSGLFGLGRNADLDVLIVYKLEADLHIAKKLISTLSDRFQIDLICMLPNEVRETKFLENQECVKLLPV